MLIYCLRNSVNHKISFDQSTQSTIIGGSIGNNVENNQPIVIRVITPANNYAFAVGMNQVLLWNQDTQEVIWHIAATLH